MISYKKMVEKYINPVHTYQKLNEGVGAGYELTFIDIKLTNVKVGKTEKDGDGFDVAKFTADIVPGKYGWYADHPYWTASSEGDYDNYNFDSSINPYSSKAVITGGKVEGTCDDGGTAWRLEGSPWSEEQFIEEIEKETFTISDTYSGGWSLSPMKDTLEWENEFRPGYEKYIDNTPSETGNLAVIEKISFNFDPEWVMDYNEAVNYAMNPDEYEEDEWDDEEEDFEESMRHPDPDKWKKGDWAIYKGKRYVTSMFLGGDMVKLENHEGSIVVPQSEVYKATKKDIYNESKKHKRIMKESKAQDIKYLKYLLRKEEVTALDDEERWELQDLINKYGYPEEYDESKMREYSPSKSIRDYKSKHDFKKTKKYHKTVNSLNEGDRVYILGSQYTDSAIPIEGISWGGLGKKKYDFSKRSGLGKTIRKGLKKEYSPETKEFMDALGCIGEITKAMPEGSHVKESYMVKVLEGPSKGKEFEFYPDELSIWEVHLKRGLKEYTVKDWYKDNPYPAAYDKADPLDRYYGIQVKEVNPDYIKYFHHTANVGDFWAGSAFTFVDDFGDAELYETPKEAEEALKEVYVTMDRLAKHKRFEGRPYELEVVGGYKNVVLDESKLKEDALTSQVRQSVLDVQAAKKQVDEDVAILDKKVDKVSNDLVRIATNRSIITESSNEIDITVDFPIEVSDKGRIKSSDAKKLLKHISTLGPIRAGKTYFVKDSNGNETCWDFFKSSDPYYQYEFSCEVTADDKDFYNCLYISKTDGKLDLRRASWEAHKVESKKTDAPKLTEANRYTHKIVIKNNDPNSTAQWRLSNADRYRYRSAEEAQSVVDEMNRLHGQRYANKGIHLEVEEIPQRPRRTYGTDDPDYENPFEVGDILFGDTGYSMILPTWVEVISKTNKTVTVRKLKDNLISHDGYGQAGQKMPVVGEYAKGYRGQYSEGRCIVKKRPWDKNNPNPKERYYIAFDDHIFTLWDGKSKTYDSYD